MRYLLFVLPLSWSALVVAQSDTATHFERSPVFAQIGVGILPTFDPLNLEISGAVGYRFNQYFGLGAEYRSTSTASISVMRSASLLGVHARGQLTSGWVASLGTGVVLGGNITDDGFTLYEYNSRGGYLATDLGYQFRWGGTVGVYATIVQSQQYDVPDYNLDTDRYELTDRTATEGLLSLGVKIGYAWPSRRLRSDGRPRSR